MTVEMFACAASHAFIIGGVLCGICILIGFVIFYLFDLLKKA